MVIKKAAGTDTNTRNRVYHSLILKKYLNWLNLKKNNRMHWLGRRKEGLLYSF